LNDQGHGCVALFSNDPLRGQSVAEPHDNDRHRHLQIHCFVCF